MATKMTIKGQVTIPKAVRDAAGLAPGDEVDVLPDTAGAVKVVKTKRQDAYRARLEKVRGSLKLGMTTDEYMRLIRGDR